MNVYILALVGIAICIFILYVIYSAHRAEERKDKAFVDTWNRNKDMEGYYIYLRKKHERACKEMMKNVRKNE